MPALSVIMTAHNTQPYVRQALRSVLRSSHRDFEVVFVDDGSTDRTGEVARSAAAQDPRVVFVDHPTHRGRREALDTAHALARGEFLTWVDSDDVVHEHAFRDCLTAIDEGHQLAYTWRRLIDFAGRDRGPHMKNDIAYAPMQLLVDNMIFHLRMFTRELFEKSEGIGHLESAIDWDMNLRMTELTNPVEVRKYLYSYRVRPGRMSGSRSQRLNAEAAVRAAISRRSLDVELVAGPTGFKLRRIN